MTRLNITIAAIRAAVCRQFDVAERDIMSPSRSAPIVRPRQVVMHLSRRMTERSWLQTARGVGRADHSTAVHAYARIQRLRDSDPEFNRRVRAVVADVHRQQREVRS